ncbi:hypothetical protein J7U46_09635 [Pelomonas sp. V22]|uniref:hypothetical protein n=1 Tax=Pelomonas sp. V22 TaxID=2822139 RepID=UPI0024A8392E|nr:hypothetical protein [Pelomonas sp. V22]MDI4633307.1 hypothetical protein [Pelomonas sp. V22]
MTETTTAPIFQSVGQALHFSYLLEALPATQKGSTQMLIESIRQQLGKLEARVSSSVNFEGLSPLELRGQCAMVRGAALNHLTSIEHDAVRARYGHRMTKAAGVRGVASYVQAMTTLHNDSAMLAVAWWNYHKPTRIADRYTLKDVAREYSCDLKAINGAIAVLRKASESLERRAHERLGELFLRTGLVEAM